MCVHKLLQAAQLQPLQPLQRRAMGRAPELLITWRREEAKQVEWRGVRLRRRLPVHTGALMEYRYLKVWRVPRNS